MKSWNTTNLTKFDKNAKIIPFQPNSIGMGDRTKSLIYLNQQQKGSLVGVGDGSNTFLLLLVTTNNIFTMKHYKREWLRKSITLK
jgi:predicted mannosyl-3-phosphoglycerate phosphatase (HAD superfamily)